MQRILIISFSDLGRDPRVRRQISSLAKRYQVTVLGRGDPGMPGVEYLHCPAGPAGPAARARAVLRLAARRYDAYYRERPHIGRAARTIGARAFDLVLANDIDALPLALAVACGAKVLFDAHEYFPREFEEVWWWRALFQPYLTAQCRRFIPRAGAMTTVCQGIAEAYGTLCGVQPQVITNAPDYADRPCRPTGTDAVAIVHHGLAIPSRRLELMVELGRALDRRYRLDFILAPGSPPGYVAWLRRLAAGDDRIRFLPPLPFSGIGAALAGYDIGLYLFPPTNFNNRMALPNKFFEFIQARLALAIGPSPEMARLVRQHDLGIVADDFSPAGLAVRLNALSPGQIDGYKRNAGRAALALSSGTNEQLLLDIVRQLIG